VTSFSGLLVDFCAQRGPAVVVKGLRGAADLDLELEMAQMNTHLTGIETLLLPTSPSLSFVSSSLVKEVARLGGDVAGLVPAYVVDRLQDRLASDLEEGRT
jgi:pantetheine-phosphate adenylyltransferase